MTAPRYAELQVTSHFSFLRGASGCDELFAAAAVLGIEALAIVDRNSLAGIVRAHEAAKTTGVRLVVGCRLDLVDGMSVLVYPTDRPAYSRLCRLLSLGKKRGGKAKCHLEWTDLIAYGDGLLAVLLPDLADDACGLRLRRLPDAFRERASLALTLRPPPHHHPRLPEPPKMATHKRGGKAKCHLEWTDLIAYGDGLLAVLLPDLADDACGLRLRRLRDAFGDRAYMALSLRRRPNDQLRLHELSNLAAQMRVPTIVTNDVLFHAPDRRILQDVVTCIRHNVTIDELGERRERHADRYLKPPEEMHRLFGRYPEALARTLQIVERCRFSLDELAYQYPEERDNPALTPQQTLAKLTWEGAAERYPEGGPDSVRATLEHELRLIEKLQDRKSTRLN